MPNDLQIKRKQVNLTSSQGFLKSAIKLGITDSTIKCLNYLDLQTLVLDMNSDLISKSLFDLRQTKLKKNGISSVKEASEEDFNNL